MENFIFSLNATAPIFLVMILGNILMKTGFLSEEFTRVSDKFVFKVALPALLFYDISTADMRDVFNLKFILFCMFTTIIMFLVIWILTWIFMKDKSMVGAFVQASARGSAAILGMAFVQNIYGDSGMAPLMIVSAVPFYNIFSVVILTFHSRDQIGLDKKAQIRRACINVAKNPIILGIVFDNLWQIHCIGSTVDNMSILKAERVILFTDTLGHSNYYKFMQTIQSHHIPFRFLHGVNIERNIVQIYDDIFEKR